MSDLTHIQPGDTLLRVYRGRDPEPVEVVRVGSKWLYVKLYSREHAYSRASGRPKDTAGGYVDRVATQEILDEEARHQTALDRLAGLGWAPKAFRRPTARIETLEAMIALLEADQ